MQTQTIPIAGMTCNSCVRSVKSTLSTIHGVEKADVTLEPPEATITSSKEIPEPLIASILGATGKYSIGEKVPEPEESELQDPDSSVPETLVGTVGGQSSAASKTFRRGTYWPLLLILAFLIGGTVILHAREGNWYWPSMMSVFMGGFFVVFSFFKFLDLRGFADAYRGYDIVAGVIPAYGYVYPFIELALGCAYLLNFNPLITNTVTLVVMIVSIAGVIRSVLSKREIRCACLGTVFNLPMSQVTIIEDGLMIVMAAVMLTRILA